MAKKGKKTAKSEEGVDGGSAGEEKMTAEKELELCQMKMTDMMEKMSRYKERCDQLTQENVKLGEMQAKMSMDRQDIVEFLNIKVNEHEKQICALEEKLKQTEQEKTQAIEASKATVGRQLSESHEEMLNLQIQCAKYKAELDQLSDFKSRKENMEQQLVQLRQQLEFKEKEYKDSIHDLERKVLQDKNLMKKEMLHKVNEAVASFRRVADQQMAETTKRTIRENMAITSQLKKMSAKTIELISQNDNLTQKITKLKTMNSLLVESEQQLAKKNQANQRVIKMLVDKLKESDKMLELAYEVYQSQEQTLQNNPVDTIQEEVENSGSMAMSQDKMTQEGMAQPKLLQDEDEQLLSQAALMQMNDELDVLRQQVNESLFFLDELIDFLATNYGINPGTAFSEADLTSDGSIADKIKLEMVMTRAWQVRALIAGDREQPIGNDSDFIENVAQPRASARKSAQAPKVEESKEAGRQKGVTTQISKKHNEVTIKDVVKRLDPTEYDDVEVKHGSTQGKRTMGTQTRVALGGMTPEMVLNNEVRPWGPVVSTPSNVSAVKASKPAKAKPLTKTVSVKV